MRSFWGWLAAAALAACLLVSWLHFRGALTRSGFEGALLAASLCWFIAATAQAGKR